jgi:ABC-type uncharacterized transport system substrate-binding protein
MLTRVFLRGNPEKRKHSRHHQEPGVMSRIAVVIAFVTALITSAFAQKAELVGGAAAWPLAARAQQPAKVPRIGILSPAASETAGTLTAFREGIRDLGYVEGQTIALDFRLSKEGVDALPALAAELVRIPVNVIVTDTTSATLAAFDATRTIPIVMGTTGGDPIALGLAKSLSRPGGNVTGTQLLTGLSQKRLHCSNRHSPEPGASRFWKIQRMQFQCPKYQRPRWRPRR